jgi:small nuclear ribonucleoprotein (snRNP)-like protein
MDEDPPKPVVSPDPFLVTDRHSVDPTSVIEYTRAFLGQRLRVLLNDGNRIFVGEFVELNHTGTMTLSEAVEYVEEHTRKLPVVVIPLEYVQSIETES